MNPYNYKLILYPTKNKNKISEKILFSLKVLHIYFDGKKKIGSNLNPKAFFMVKKKRKTGLLMIYLNVQIRKRKTTLRLETSPQIALLQLRFC